MHAIRLHAFGPAENLAYERVADPEPAAGQVRIAVAAAGVHVLDTALRQGELGPYPAPPELPTIPGREVAGTVDALGEGVDQRWLGRRVVAHLGLAPGGYAEKAVVAVEKLHELPDGLREDHAIAMIGTGRTTMAVLRFSDLTADDVAIVTAAAGGIGSLLVQHAKNVGATVIGLAGGPEKVARVRELGADVAVDYTADDWTAQVRAALGGRERAATALFDAVGGDVARDAVGLLAPGGRHLVYGWSGGGPLKLTEEELAELGVTSLSVLETPEWREFISRPGALRELEETSMAEAASGRLVPLVHRFPLAEAAKAHTALETRGTIGKVVLVP
ncbi:zinc-binding dehydrogenase [Streptomyces sp. LX-29]|uniref:zinc-binding dehydrogenase n=1 Tax=Streptomyces sp. LX-29 TaxID=2900152 RepID=UPI00240DE1F4|nr:zinc-binding dehydrogenase [Streptomyces sp. LX-29]WFB08820.1 zinc-binding dehydrogenase [Streptomyces sp. LX-29]